VSEIRPAVEDKNNPLQDILRTPYGQDRRTNLKCPVCDATLINKTSYFLCPNHDGILAFGSLLTKLRSGKFDVVPQRKASATIRNADITCPSCGNMMTRVPYNNGPVVIDTCSRCPYRWLDAGEFSKALPAASK
jgi:Zn-finger nucleic acid-binding protein